jgi:hypothetical protein
MVFVSFILKRSDSNIFNMFASLGNGMILAEKLNGEVAPYIGNSDIP